MIYVVRYTLIVLYTVFWGSLAALVGLFDRTGEPVMWIARQWVRWILATCRIEVVIEGLDGIDTTRSHIWMSNHQSVFDTATIIATIPVSFRFVAKRELTRIPFFGWGLRAGRHVIVDRGNQQTSIANLRQAAEQVASGTDVIVFPEGTRSTEGRLGPLKSGGFHLAIESGAPIVPITVSGSRFITPKKSLRIESGRVKVRYGTPIATQHLRTTDRNELKRQVSEAILGGFDEDLQEGRDHLS